MSKHSPGPWRWFTDEKDRNQLMKLRDRDGEVVCDFGREEQYYPATGIEPTEDDARLIAAAPEMLRLLRDAVPCDGSEAVMWQDRVNELLKRIDGDENLGPELGPDENASST